jgi:hypothetical protein
MILAGQAHTRPQLQNSSDERGTLKEESLSCSPFSVSQLADFSSILFKTRRRRYD